MARRGRYWQYLAPLAILGAASACDEPSTPAQPAAAGSPPDSLVTIAHAASTSTPPQARSSRSTSHPTSQHPSSDPTPAAPLAASCDAPIAHFADGALQATQCPAVLTAQGLTIVDISDDWTPALFRPGPLYVAEPVAEPAADPTAEPTGTAMTEQSAQRDTETATMLAAPAAHRVESPPAALAPKRPVDVPAYRDTYRALANERFDNAGADSAMAAHDHYLELYGVFPAPSVIHARMSEDERHSCHRGIDNAALQAMSGVMWEEKAAAGHERKRTAHRLRLQLTRDAERRGLRAADALQTGADHRDVHRDDNRDDNRDDRRADSHDNEPASAASAPNSTAGPDHHNTLDILDQLAAVGPYYQRQVARLRRLEAVVDAITAAETHLACEGLLAERHLDGVFDWRTGEALGLYQRRHFVVARGQLDPATRAALVTDSRDLDVRAALRMLRERVIDATGIIEDGSAVNQQRAVLGHLLDPDFMHAVPGHDPLPGGSPDLAAEATEAAARALGWRDFDSIRAWLGDAIDEGGFGPRVALALPAAPDYHQDHMELRVEIDRGDVWYDRTPVRRRVERRPALTVYALVEGREIPLLRWPTTIGGWQKEQLSSGAIVNRFKDSDVGPRLWRQLYAAPAWLPPTTTPDNELVRRDWQGNYSLKLDNFGPGYRSAYGLAMFIHHQQLKPGPDGEERYGDRSIRTHGSASYSSIVRGVSHGCHRLFNHQVLRLASFVLQHRDHRRHGDERRNYQRVVQAGGRHVLTLNSRGYQFELTPPIPVDVTKGRIRSRNKRPPR